MAAVPAPPPSRAFLSGVGLIAAGTLLLEISLTRIFSVTLWYYFGFLVISLAMSGLAIAALVCLRHPERYLTTTSTAQMIRFATSCALAGPLAVAVHSRWSFEHYAPTSVSLYLALSGQLLLVFLAFFSAGMCVSMALLRPGTATGRIYAADLLGASLGSFLIVPLLSQWSPFAVTFLASTAAALAGWLFAVGSPIRVRMGLAFLALVSLWCFGVNDPWRLLTVRMVKSYEPFSVQALERGILFERWSPFARVTVELPTSAGGVSHLLLKSDAGAPTVLRRFDGDYQRLRDLRGDSRQVAHRLRPNAHVLVIGSGGGRDVLAALACNQRSITAVELNPVTVDVVTRRFADYIGRIFDDPRVTLRNREGRQFLAASRESYDIIQLGMIDSWIGAAAGAYIFNENSLYTVEAMQDYLAHLNPTGWLAITRFYDWDEALRLTNLIIQALEERGVEDASGRITVVVESPRPYRHATVLVKADSVTPEDTRLVLQDARRGGYQVVYAPHARPEELDPSTDASVFRALIHPKTAGLPSRAEFVRSYPRDVSPPTDDRPFFFFMERLRQTFHVDLGSHAARRLAMPILYGTCAVLGFFGAVTLFLPLTWQRTLGQRGFGRHVSAWVYFGSLGIGYMLLELSWIHRLTVFLGHPAYSFVVVLTTLLCSSGIGSAVSGRWRGEQALRILPGVLTAVVVLGVVEALVVYDRLIQLMWLPQAARILMAVATIGFPGFLMGMCFPLGLDVVQRRDPRLAAWGWAANGACSVWAAVLELVLALQAGLKATLLVGTLGYCAALVISLRWRSAPRPS